MLRIRDSVIKIVTEHVIEGNISVTAAIDEVKGQIADGLAKLSKVADDFDEVVIDKEGNLHCKNIATPESEGTDE